ncbi:MAG: arylamine N-acetyltransferase [Pirellulaceae bacterium]
MSPHPLDPPANRALLEQFVQHFQLELPSDPFRSLAQVAAAFSRLPYENLSKVLRYHDARTPAGAREQPQDIVAGHLRWGTGGTCFSLTATLLHLVRTLGISAQPILADRSYGSDTHCALVTWLDGAPYLIDPGFLLVQPVRLPTTSPAQVVTPVQDVVLVPQQNGERIELWTPGSASRPRLTFKTSPVDDAEFLQAWDASFDWDMMHYPVLTRVDETQQRYLRAGYHQVRDRSGVQRTEFREEELPTVIAREFGIDASVVRRALEVLRRAGHSARPT